MKTRITPLSLGLLFTAAYAAPLLLPQLRLTPSEVDSMPAQTPTAAVKRSHAHGQSFFSLPNSRGSGQAQFCDGQLQIL